MDVNAYQSGYNLMTGMIGLFTIAFGIIGPVFIIIIIINVLHFFTDVSDE